MEVHHHSHHPKKWKEYITEFLMLFAAVTLGFLAENIREGYVEKERAHELISSFIQDVNHNVEYIDSILIADKSMLRICDSTALYIIKTPKELDLKYIYRIPSTSIRYLSNNDTYDQMKSSGSLRYIKDTILLRKIIEYSNLSKATEFRSVSQEFNYFANEYMNTLNKYIPVEIAAEKHVQFILNNSKNFISDSSELKFYNESENSVKNKVFILPENKIKEFKQDLVPVIYRRTTLIGTTINFMHKTRESAIDLLEYHQRHN